jgi:hypothetical protein
MVTCLAARNVNNLKYTGIFPSGEDDIHNDAPQSVGLLWTSDKLVAETSI